MSPPDIQAKAAWLKGLTGSNCPWPIVTTDDLRDYALDIEETCREDLTGAEMQQVKDLIESLDPPDVQQQRAIDREKAKQEAHAWFRWTFLRGHTLSKAGAEAHKKYGDQTRAKVTRIWKQLSREPKRRRADIIASRLGVSARHVRRMINKEGLK